MSDATPRFELPRRRRLPKEGGTPEECEDHAGCNPSHSRLAVADGATESSYASRWAKLLVERFVISPGISDPNAGDDQWGDWLGPAQAMWQAHIDRLNLPWFAQDKVEAGAYAAFLGLQLGANAWRAVAVGDCCLFHLRRDQVIDHFPIGSTDEFSYRPRLLGSKTPPGSVAWAEVAKRKQGVWEDKDEFLLMSDALAKWFLTECEADNSFGALALTTTLTDDEFAAQVATLRETGKLQNDDITLLHVIARHPRE